MALEKGNSSVMAVIFLTIGGALICFYPRKHFCLIFGTTSGSAKDAPFGGGALGDYVFIPKSQGDFIFSLKQGDKIQLRSGTHIRKAYIGGVTFIEFIATSVTKL